jgi:hypothetical protein
LRVCVCDGAYQSASVHESGVGGDDECVASTAQG